MRDAKMFWKVQKELCKDNLIGIQAMGDDEFLIALVFEPDTAELIAAAPELIAALRELLYVTEPTFDNRHEREAALNAIAKATGEQP